MSNSPGGNELVDRGKYYCEDLDENLGPADSCYFDPCPYKTHCTVYKEPETSPENYICV